MGIPYLPVLGLVGSQLLRNRDDMVVAPDPFGEGYRTVVAKALRPDVALIHVPLADWQGNAFCGVHNDDVLLAEASRTVIVTAEQVVERLDGRFDELQARGTLIPGLLVQGVAEARYGAHPAGCPGVYPVDDAHMTRYAEQAQSDESFAAYLAATVFDLSGHEAYVEHHVPRGWGTAAATQTALRAAGD